MHSKCSTPRRGRMRAAVALFGTGALALATGVAILAAGGPAAATSDNAKYFVCKYVGKPGVDERLQTGQNPISVNENAIAETPVVVGSYFADAQGRSYVIEQDTGQPEPDVGRCPAPQGPQPVQPPDQVVQRTETSTSCQGGLEQRTVTVTTPYVWDETGQAWVLGTAGAPAYGDWQVVRALTTEESQALGCVEETQSPSPSEPVAPSEAVAPSQAARPPRVKGTEAVAPHKRHGAATRHAVPRRQPTVLGTEAVAAPGAAFTAVSAGLAGPAGTGGPTNPWGPGLVGAGVALMVTAGGLALGRRAPGAHQG